MELKSWTSCKMSVTCVTCPSNFWQKMNHSQIINSSHVDVSTACNMTGLVHICYWKHEYLSIKSKLFSLYHNFQIPNLMSVKLLVTYEHLKRGNSSNIWIYSKVKPFMWEYLGETALIFQHYRLLCSYKGSFRAQFHVSVHM